MALLWEPRAARPKERAYSEEDVRSSAARVRSHFDLRQRNPTRFMRPDTFRKLRRSARRRARISAQLNQASTTAAPNEAIAPHTARAKEPEQPLRTLSWLPLNTPTGTPSPRTACTSDSSVMPSSIDDPSAGLLGDEEAPMTDCRSMVRGVGVVTLAFGGLVITNVCVLLFKELSQIDGEYLYNPASALCMAEIGKFLVSCCVRTGTKQAYEPFLPKTVPVELSLGGDRFSLLYAVYNQLTFVVLTKASASTVALFKATTPTLVALLLWLLHGERINKLQWAATVLQMAGLVLVAEGAASEGILEGETEWWGAVEFLLVLMAILGALAAVWNSKALKGIDTPMPILNMFLYIQWGVLQLYDLRAEVGLFGPRCFLWRVCDECVCLS